MSINEPDARQAVGAAQRWLLLIHQLPAKPAYLRVKVWRRLQGIGAVAVKNGVYALPTSAEAQEDFEWLRREITEAGGEALVCEARFVDGLSDPDVRQLFNRARDAEYEQIADEARALAAAFEDDTLTDSRTEKRTQLMRLRKRLTSVAAIDFFGANGRESIEGLLGALEEKIDQEAQKLDQHEAKLDLRRIGKGRIWVTRRDVHVDRIASAWLIRRFIDPKMRLKFVAGHGYVPELDEVRFDMFDGEFTHEGDRCTFEVLRSRAGLDDAALEPIAEIVHDIDLKDGKFGRDEADGISTLIGGICAAAADDQERIARGSAVFEDLYQYFRRKRG